MRLWGGETDGLVSRSNPRVRFFLLCVCVWVTDCHTPYNGDGTTYRYIHWYCLLTKSTYYYSSVLFYSYFLLRINGMQGFLFFLSTPACFRKLYVNQFTRIGAGGKSRRSTSTVPKNLHSLSLLQRIDYCYPYSSINDREEVHNGCQSRMTFNAQRELSYSVSFFAHHHTLKHSRVPDERIISEPKLQGTGVLCEIAMLNSMVLNLQDPTKLSTGRDCQSSGLRTPVSGEQFVFS